MPRFIDLTGQKFGRYKVLSRHGKLNNSTAWLCDCECGNQRVVAGCSLRKGLSLSCGCLRSDTMSMRQQNQPNVSRLGESRVMKNGLTATIVGYRDANDIDVEIDGGIVLKNRTYQNFTKENMKCPDVIECHGDYSEVKGLVRDKWVSFLIDTEDLYLVEGKNWRLRDGYVIIYKEYEKNKSLHGLIMDAPEDMQVDHINMNRSDNRKSNLRLCTQHQNLLNRKHTAKNKVGYKGVYWHKGKKKWIAQIGYNGRTMQLGTFHAPEAAAKAYNEAAIKYHGEFARLNKI